MTIGTLSIGLADLTQAVTDYELGWRNRDYDGPLSACASAERRREAALEVVGFHLGREQAEMIYRAMVMAAADTRSDSETLKGDRQYRHRHTTTEIRSFVKEG